MSEKKARQIDPHNAAVAAYDEWIAANPPQITWRFDPFRRVQVAVEVIDPSGISGRTHCKRLHLFDEANTITKTDGTRECRECKRRLNREARKRRLARRQEAA